MSSIFEDNSPPSIFTFDNYDHLMLISSDSATTTTNTSTTMNTTIQSTMSISTLHHHDTADIFWGGTDNNTNNISSVLADGLAWGVPCLNSPKVAMSCCAPPLMGEIQEKLSSRLRFSAPQVDLYGNETTTNSSMINNSNSDVPPQLSPADSERNFNSSRENRKRFSTSVVVGVPDSPSKSMITRQKSTTSTDDMNNTSSNSTNEDDEDNDDDIMEQDNDDVDEEEEQDEEEEDDEPEYDSDDDDDSDHHHHRRNHRRSSTSYIKNKKTTTSSPSTKRMKTTTTTTTSSPSTTTSTITTNKSGNPTTLRACKKCSKTYTSREGLRLHIRNVHLQDKKHVCEQCKVRFVRGGDLRLHYLRVHCPLQERPFPCTLSTCDKAFASKSELTRHMKTHGIMS
jgi:hypothetical protein